MLRVDENLKSLIPPHSADERKQLEANIEQEGRVRDKIIVWKGHGIIVEGMTRFEIAIDKGYPYETEEMEFDSYEEVRQWIYDNQLGRRNLSPMATSAIRATRASILKDKAVRERTQGIKPKEKPVASTAKEFGVSERTIQRDLEVAEILSKQPQKIRNKILSGEIEATIEDVKKLEELPEEVHSKVVDLFEYGSDQQGVSAFDTLDDVLKAATQSAKIVKKGERLLKDEEEADKIIRKLFRILDDRKAETKQKDFHELCTSALRNLNSHWEDWKKSDRISL